ncbi:putative spermatogenesis-associated protein 31C2, partial [Mesoplodon densirostris]|uniref:putative spermatogenesis-associated protein 31C2 n=1 Tax=Mesoplodon densirostris TaxID=48708 RepID=UPI0028DC845A
DNLASQVPQCHPQRVPTRDTLASQEPSGLMEGQRSNLGQQEPQKKKKPISATARSHGSVQSRSTLKSETAEGQALMPAVGQIVEETRAIHHGLHATKLNEHRLECQVPVSRQRGRSMRPEGGLGRQRHT